MHSPFMETREFLKAVLEARLKVFSQPGLKTSYNAEVPSPGSIENTIRLIESAEAYAKDGGVLALSHLVSAAQGREYKHRG